MTLRLCLVAFSCMFSAPACSDLLDRVTGDDQDEPDQPTATTPSSDPGSSNADDGAADEPVIDIDGGADEPPPDPEDPPPDFGYGQPGYSPDPGSPDPAPTPPQVDVTLAATYRAIIANGTMYVEATFEWSATGAPDLLVDIHMKTSQAPEWTNIITDQPTVDVAQYNVTGGRQDYWFRAVAQHPAFPGTLWVSNIEHLSQ